MKDGSAKKSMLLGAILCVGGIVATAMTYSGTASTAELPYVFAWAAIIFGSIQIVRGVVNLGPDERS